MSGTGVPLLRSMHVSYWTGPREGKNCHSFDFRQFVVDKHLIDIIIPKKENKNQQLLKLWVRATERVDDLM